MYYIDLDLESRIQMISCVTQRGRAVDYDCEQSDYGAALYGLAADQQSANVDIQSIKPDMQK